MDVVDVIDVMGSPPRQEEPHQPSSRGRSGVIRILICLGFVALTAQLWKLQIVDGRVHTAAAEGNRLRLVDIPALRGVIYDRNFELLAFNAPTFMVSVTEADLPQARRTSILADTAQLLGITPTEIEQTIETKRAAAGPFAPIVIKKDVPRDVALTLEQQSWALPGIYLSVDTLRQYVDSETFSQVIGYTSLPTAEEYTQSFEKEGYGPDERVGSTGVERVYETDLRGRPGVRLIEADVGGRPLNERQRRPPQQGRELILTIDAQLQRAVHQILANRLAAKQQEMERAAAARPGATPATSAVPPVAGVAVVTDPRNGEVLSMVSYPGFDANVFYARERDGEIERLLSDPSLPLFNRAVDGQYPPGSTFKLVTGVGALEERTASRYTQINCNGELRIPNPNVPGTFTRLPDWGVMGTLDFVQGIAQSCNVYFYTLGGGFGSIEGLGSARLARYARMMGYGEPTGIDLPSEGNGRIPEQEWKQANIGEPWVPGDTYNMAIGQGFVLATPLQVATVTNTIATGGTTYRPHVVRAVVDGDRQPVRSITTEASRRVALRPETLGVLRDGMIGTLDTAQTRAHKLPGIQVAGKTGTAEFNGPRDEKGNLPTHAWFTAYAPAQNPRVSVTVFMERGGGPTDAVPLAMEILKAYFAQNP